MQIKTTMKYHSFSYLTKSGVGKDVDQWEEILIHSWLLKVYTNTTTFVI